MNDSFSIRLSFFTSWLLRSQFLRSAGMYTGASFLNKSIPFLILPVLTRFMSPADYGIVSMFAVLVGLFTPFVNLSVHISVQRQYYERSTFDFSTYVFNCLAIVIFNVVIFSFVLVLLKKPLSNVSQIDENWLYGIVFLTAARGIIQILLSIYQGQVKPISFGIFQVSETLLDVCISLLLVVVYHLGWRGRMIGQLTGFVLFACLAVILLIRDGWITPRLRRPHIVKALRFGLPLIPYACGAFVMTMISRACLTFYQGVSATGLFTVGSQIGMVIGLISTSFNNAYVPWLFSKLKEDTNQSRAKITSLTCYYCIGLIAFAFIWSFIIPFFMPLLVGKHFIASLDYIFWCSMGFAFDGIYVAAVAFINFAEKNRYLVLITVLGAVISILLNIALIKINGPVGAAQATAAVSFLRAACTWFLVTKFFDLPWFKRSLTIQHH